MAQPQVFDEFVVLVPEVRPNAGPVGVTCSSSAAQIPRFGSCRALADTAAA